jgi:ATP-dependent DNA helicase DinG
VLDSIARKFASLADEETSEAAGAADALLDAAAVLRVSFPKPPSRLVVRFNGLARPNPSSWRLVATPVSPAADFQCEILDHVETFFGTSATVGVGDDRLGSIAGLELDQTAAGRFEVSSPIESPFDYANHLKVIFISDATDHNRLVERTVTAVQTVAKRLQGRTMALFTSRDRLARASEQLDERLGPEGITIIAPATGSADPHELVRGFMETEHAVLLGARAFWQGVDIAGDACRAVVIEKLPFAVPGDPLIERRGQIIEQEGGNAFMDYALPNMLLKLKQMMGRLIRTPSDTGVIVVVEPRTDRRYFKRLYDAMPRDTKSSVMPLAELDASVEEFFRRL